MTLPYTADELVDLSLELIGRNDQHQDVYLRPVAYKDQEILGVLLHGLTNDLIITSEPLEPHEILEEASRLRAAGVSDS